MQYTLDRFTHDIRAALEQTGRIPADLTELSEPKASLQADLALACFRAAKAQGGNPAKLAQELAATLQFPPDALVGKVEASGPFLNFTLNAGQFGGAVLGDVIHGVEHYGDDDLGASKTVIVEYSSPNVAKRMHVGHIRSTIIGQALLNILAALGYHTISDNHLGDWGKQFGTNIASMIRFGRPEGNGEAALAEIERLYQRYNRMMKGENADTDDEADDEQMLDDEARSWSLKLEQGDPTARELWQWMCDMTLRVNQRNYDRLGVHFDMAHGESFYRDMTAPVIEEALAAGIAMREPGGAVVVKDLSDERGHELPTFLLQRSDGGTLYQTRDVATIEYREREYRPAIVIYVVEQRQELHFRQAFALAKALGHARDTQLVHVHFGTIFGANGEPLSTRKGNMVYLEALLNDAEARARAVVLEKIGAGKTELPPEEIDAIASAVGIGAVVYNDLYQDVRRNITLDWERMLAFEGNSAPYLQYTFARCCSILREALNRDTSANLLEGLPPFEAMLLREPQEQAVLKQIARLPDAVRRAGQAFAPYIIAEWLYTTAREFARFYRDLSVLKAATPELRAARLALVAATAQSLRNGLHLLGLAAPERM
ncbi:MAG: arginine--tRNA ligase [Herpetosiphonaceae bacterium]|nr:arginine--tRNA ligase [Herpetosiphonaceae bacterium]